LGLGLTLQWSYSAVTHIAAIKYCLQPNLLLTAQRRVHRRYHGFRLLSLGGTVVVGFFSFGLSHRLRVNFVVMALPRLMRLFGG
jgi:hypothetical protein